MDIGLNDLRVFLRVATSASLSEAARAARLTPAAVSAIVKRLEREFGTRLVERSTRACRLTPEGEALRRSAAAALEALDELRGDWSARTALLKGVVRLAAPTDLARGLVGRVLDAFQQAHPAVEIVLRSSDAVQDLLRDEIDLALRYGELPDSGLVARRIALTRRLTCASPAYLRRHGVPRVPADLRAHRAVLFEVGGRPDEHWSYQTPEGPVRVRVAAARRTDDSAIAKQWALQGHGLINKSDIDLRDELADGRLVELLAGFAGPTVPLSLVTRHRRQPAAVRALGDAIAGAVAQALQP